MARITILTDFGTADGYVAAMKGVLAARAPDAVLDDAGHDLPRGVVPHASWVLGRYWSLYPAGTVHLVVIDPGVGTARRAVAVEAGGRFGVGPDNGVFSRILRAHPDARTVALEVPPDASATFHGRDVFAPAAARLAAGAVLADLGAPVSDPYLLPASLATGASDPRSGVVRAVDRFGNLITDLPGHALGPEGARIGGERAVRVGTYGEAPVDALVALVGSDGTVEVAVRDGSAAARLGVGPGARVTLS